MMLRTLADVDNVSDNHLLSPASSSIANIHPHDTQSFTTNSSHILDKVGSLLNNDQLPNSSSNNNQSSSTMNQDDLWWQLPRVDNFVDLFTILCSLAVIFGGLIPYIPQYVKIKRSMDSDGFSTYVCLTLLIANILRIMFWFGHRFETPLLIQSFVMITGMLAMMEICIRVKDKRSSYTISAIDFGSSNHSSRSRRFLNNGKRHRNGTSSESLPIYSALPSSSSISHQTIDCSSDNRQANAEATNYKSIQTNNLVRGDIDNSNSGNSLSSNVVEISSVNKDSYDYESLVLSYSSLHNSESQEQQQQQVHQQELNLTRLPLGQQLNSINQAFKCFDAKNFWNWDDYWSYLRFLSLFTLILSLTTYLLLDKYLYVEILGYVAVFTESMLGMPQLLRNYSKKSTLGMSVEMVIMWLSGDLFKTLYFIIRRAPAQFYVCGSIQVVVDILILYQVLWYKRPSVTYRKLLESN